MNTRLIVLCLLASPVLAESTLIKRGTESRVILYGPEELALPQVLIYEKYPDTINDVPIFLTNIKKSSSNSNNENVNSASSVGTELSQVHDDNTGSKEVDDVENTTKSNKLDEIQKNDSESRIRKSKSRKKAKKNLIKK